MIDSKTLKKVSLKVFLAIVLGTMAALALFGCASQQSSSSSSASNAVSNSSSSEEIQSDSASVPTGRDNGKSLVVYFSATGNTAHVAAEVANATSSASFEIVPAEGYTDDDLDYNDSKSRVSREHDDKSLRDVKLKSTTVANWDEYKTIYIGYPIWWGEAAWPIAAFVKANDFAGKTVIPFCTSASSGIGDSAEELAEIAGGGTWLAGKRFSGNATEDDVKEWLATI